MGVGFLLVTQQHRPTNSATAAQGPVIAVDEGALQGLQTVAQTVDVISQ
jgi:hypothetical protein